MASLHPDDLTFYNTLTPADREDFERTAQKLSEHMSSPRVESALSAEVSNAVSEFLNEAPQAQVNIPKIKPGLMAMGEMDEQDVGEDEEFEGDDMTSLAHGELEQHREIREYARIAAWEMPLLSSKSIAGSHPGTIKAYKPSPNRTSKTFRSSCCRCPSPLSLYNLHG